MKKFIVLAIAAALMCSAAFANATEFKVSGQFDLTAQSVDNIGFVDEGGTNGVQVKERFRTQIDIIASENVSGVVYFEIGDVVWGEGDSANLGTDGVNIETRRAYVNFVVPNTSVAVSAGLMGLVLPNAVAGTPVFNDDVAAATVSVPFNDNFSATAFFARASSGEKEVKGVKTPNTVTGHNYGEFDKGFDVAGGLKLAELDLFGLIAPVTFENGSVTPYAVIAKGESNGNDAQFVWIGAAAKANLIDNLKLAADVIYSDANVSIENGKDVDGSGFFLAGSAAYDTEFGTPKLAAWWSEGNEKDGELGFAGFAGWFGPTTMGFDGGSGRSACDTISSDGVGTAGVALSIEDVSFIKNVDHKVIFAYYELTQYEKGSTPSATEIDFVTDWQMYESLSATLEFAYVMPDWKNDAKDKDGKDIEKDAANMFKSAVSLKYAF